MRTLKIFTLSGGIAVSLIFLTALYSLHSLYKGAWEGTSAEPLSRYSADFLRITKGYIDPSAARIIHAKLTGVRDLEGGGLRGGMLRWPVSQLGLYAYLMLFVEDDLNYERLLSFGYFGGVDGKGLPAAGVRFGARALFDSQPADLEVAQAVSLIAFFNVGPSAASNQKLVFKNRNRILSRLEAQRVLSGDEAARAKALPIRLQREN